MKKLTIVLLVSILLSACSSASNRVNTVASSVLSLKSEMNNEHQNLIENDRTNAENISTLEAQMQKIAYQINELRNKIDKLEKYQAIKRFRNQSGLEISIPEE